MTRLRAWAVELHGGQLVMLLLGLLLTCLGSLFFAAVLFARAADAEVHLRRATDYSNYHAQGEGQLSDADLWEKKRDQFWSEPEATAYVAGRPERPRGQASSPIEERSAQFLSTERRTAVIARSGSTTLLALAGLSLLFAVWTLWCWFGGRKASAERHAAT